MKVSSILLDFLEYTIKQKLTHEGINPTAIIEKYLESQSGQLIDIEATLKVLPGKIRDKQAELINLQAKVFESEAKVRSQEGTILMAVTSEKQEDKPRFKNDTQRKIEIDRRLGKDSGFVKTKEELSANKQAIKTLEFDTEFLQRTHRSAIAICMNPRW